ncbi:MAG: 50S ribosomal protein L7/L12 [Anaerolineae bacterium]|nr:50S ribosomal protein L7/L12 [Anaerolineae bacterium]
MANLEKLAEELGGLTLLEASQLKTMLEEQWGVTAAAPMAMGAMPSMMATDAAPVADEQTEFDVVITDVGPKKIQIIKEVRALTNLGLKEAKDLVEATPATVMQGVSKDAATDAKTRLEAEGAVVEVK